MAYLVWILTILAIILGFLLGLILGMTHDYRKKAVGTLLIGYTGEEDDSAHLFLNMDKAVEDIEGSEYAVLRIKRCRRENNCPLYGGNSEHYIFEGRNSKWN